MLRAIFYGTAAVINFVAFVAQAGFGLSLWDDPKLGSGLICAGLAIAAAVQFEVALGRRAHV